MFPTMEATLTGTPLAPVLQIRFAYGAALPVGGSAQEWCQSLPDRWFEGAIKTWCVAGTGNRPSRVLAQAGVVWKVDPDSELVGTVDLDDLWRPVLKLSRSWSDTALVYPRLAGYTRIRQMVGPAASWDQKARRFEVRITDLVDEEGNVPKGLQGPSHLLPEMAQRIRDRIGPVHPAALELSVSSGVDHPGDTTLGERARELIETLKADTGLSLPDDFGLALYPYQEAGAYATAGGVLGLNDEPGLGKTRTALAAAAIYEAGRILVICPPLVLLNWAREASIALTPIFTRLYGEHFARTGPKTNPDPAWTTVVRPGRKVPEFPEHGVLMVADSLLAARPELAKEVLAWSPQAVICDEVHRLGNWSTARGSAVRRLTGATDGISLALTGTPMQAKPTELANQLAITGSLERDFCSARAFLETYTREDHFGGRAPIKKNLPDLGRLLKQGPIVRRLKSVVLPQLPKKTRALMPVSISTRAFDTAHRELEEKVKDWLLEYQDQHGRPAEEDAVREWAKTNVGLISPLRVAAGRAKVPAAVELISAIMEETAQNRSEDGGYADPIIVWAHHSEVLKDLLEAMPDKWPTAVIDGSVPADQRTLIADRFQAGEIAVLFCSVIAAGFGITLTRGCNSYFVETDWTPANIAQAEDRQARIGQTRPVLVTTLVAEETLDPHIRAVLASKEENLDAVLPGSDHRVTHVGAVWREDGTLEQVEVQSRSAMKNEADILVGIAEKVQAKMRPKARARR